MTKLLVIDASVVRAAGTNEHPVSSATRLFLEGVLRICHRVAMTSEIRGEWKEHQSKLSRRWMLAMYARKKVVELQVHQDPSFGARVTAGYTPEERQHILKDLHLIRAALAADRIVVALDEDARRLFQAAELRVITWVNPVERERVLGWLEEGAAPVEEWQLGYSA